MITGCVHNMIGWMVLRVTWLIHSMQCLVGSLTDRSQRMRNKTHVRNEGLDFFYFQYCIGCTQRRPALLWSCSTSACIDRLVWRYFGFLSCVLLLFNCLSVWSASYGLYQKYIIFFYLTPIWVLCTSGGICQKCEILPLIVIDLRYTTCIYLKKKKRKKDNKPHC